MNFIKILLGFVCLTSLGCLFAAGVGLAGETSDSKSIRIAVEGAFPPFNYVDSNNQLQGFDVDIGKALCKVAELKCEFVVQEWTTMIPDLLADRFDAIVSSMSMSAERRKSVAFTQKYYDSPSVFIVRKGSNIAGTGMEDLKKLRLGVTAATSQEAYARRFYAGVSTTEFHASPDLYKALVDGSVDIIIEDKLAIYDWLANTKAGSCCEYKGSDIKNTEYFGDGAGIAVRPSDTELLKKLNSAIEVIEADDTYDTINAKYFPFSIR
ncbi:MULTISPECIES: transporter substrate-binding domain-containing protein [Rhizobium]|uniref:Transporter substrate-binding domain-containing protein n=1 Tax=Rhizobium rhododendri TaxID=2506430 RepID=A0ABY8IPY6_9HYPH|nr:MULTISPECIES: transporter substrate-binding domain-containing protein [Rhizobium]QXZ80438.1 transporter substrate-binding domain-containing protein [Rhizobium sp. L51/94]QYA04653.1 transporter substrate-binding domain-containing protein [Rhizobium sp. B21/90]TQX85960.1 transporter substrate-binding domain-containing protein [Rhizobium sp. rho-13.1]TQY10926.1 transporter substrate-binding domain-containing protein [Rhizobium sp. rho-1.1]WFS25767.1 transporter substrate-binding domain-contain